MAVVGIKEPSHKLSLFFIGHKMSMDSEATDSEAGILMERFSRRSFISSSTVMSTPMTTNNLSSCSDGGAGSDKSGWTNFTRTIVFVCSHLNL